ncbi:MAG TPA: MFS transporter [bacterium]|nr:MFS transporter [bacterium]
MRANLWKLKLLRTFFWMFFFSSVLIPFFTEWGHLKLSQVFFLNAWFMFWNFALEVPTGTVADRFGRKASLVIGSAVSGLASVLYVSRPAFAVFLAAEVLFAVAYTLHSGADEALAYDSLMVLGRENEAKKTLAAMESFKLGGIIFATIAGGWIASLFGYDAPMRAYAAPAAIAVLISLTLKEAPRISGEKEIRPYFSILREGARYFAGHKTLLLLTLELAVTNAMAWTIIWLFQPALAKGGLAIKYYGLVHAAACVGQILFLTRVEKAESWAGSKSRVLKASAFALALGFAVLGAASYRLTGWANLCVTIPAVVVTFASGLSRVPIFSSYMNAHIPSEKRATVLSFVSMCRTFAIVVVSPAVGMVADRSLTWAFFGLSAAVAVVTLFSRIEERHLQEENRP